MRICTYISSHAAEVDRIRFFPTKLVPIISEMFFALSYSICPRMMTRTCIRTYIHTYVHTYIHTHTHTYTHTHRRTHPHRHRDRQRQTETDRDRQRPTETDRDGQRRTETDRDRCQHINISTYRKKGNAWMVVQWHLLCFLQVFYLWLGVAFENIDINLSCIIH